MLILKEPHIDSYDRQTNLGHHIGQYYVSLVLIRRQDEIKINGEEWHRHIVSDFKVD